MKKFKMKKFAAVFMACLLVTGLAISRGAEAAENLVVYSTQTAEITTYFTEKFEAETGIDVEIVAGGGGEIIKRVEAEQANPLGDIVWSIGTESLDAQKHLFEAYQSPETAHFVEGFVDKGFQWTCDFVMPFVIIYNKDAIAEADLPAGWGDLTDPKYKGQIAFADPMRSGSSYTQVATFLSVFGDGEEGWDFMKKFIANLDNKLLQGSTDVPKRVSDGEYMLGLTSETFATEYIRAGSRMGIIYPKEGTVPYSTALGIVKGAPNAANAQKFMDFMLSQRIEQEMTNTFFKRSIRDDVSPAEGMAPITDIKFIDYDLEWAASEKEKIMEQWKNLIVGGA